KAAIAAGTTTDPTWAAPLATIDPLRDGFVRLLRPQELIGRIPGLRRVAFNVSVPVQTSDAVYMWVGQKAVKAVSSMTFSTVSLPGATKAAGIIALTEELFKLTSDQNAAALQAALIAGIQLFVDVQFCDPSVAPVADVTPGAITNGLVAQTPSGTTASALQA